MGLKGDNDVLTNVVIKCFREKDFTSLNENIFNGRINVAKSLVDMWPNLFSKKVSRVGADGIVVEKMVREYRLSLPAIIETLKENRRHLNL